MFGQQQRPAQARPVPGQVQVLARPVTVPAFRYVYSLQKQEWVETQTNVCIPNPSKGFEAGGMRICFEIQEVDDMGQRTDMVAKFFRKNIDRVVEIDYFNEAAAQCMSEEFAQNFNQRLSECRFDPNAVFKDGIDTAGMCRISFLMCTVLRIRASDLPADVQRNPALFGPNSFFTFRTTDKNEVMFVMEYKLKGTFTKYNNNFGDTYEESDNTKVKLTPVEAAKRARVFKFSEAFSHFSLKESGGSMLVCDLQGVNDFFTDPQIHTEDGKGLGMGNMGQEGIDKWGSKHQCNEVCRAIGLRDLNAPAPAPTTASSSSHYAAFLHQPALFQPRPPTNGPAPPQPPAPMLQPLYAPSPAVAAPTQGHQAFHQYPSDLLTYLQNPQPQQQQQTQGSPQHPPPPPPPGQAAFTSFPVPPPGGASPPQGGGAGPSSPPKPLSQMSEDELMQLAIQRSIMDQGRR